MHNTDSTLEPASVAADPYAPPTAALDERSGDTIDSARFYVVSAAKFWSLSIATVSLYGIYWMYRQWAHIKRASKGDEWPVARAIFQVFFVHSLTAEIDQRLRRAAIRHDWSPQGLATITVVVMIATSVLDRLAGKEIGSPVTDVLSIVGMVVLVFCKSRIQLAANAACGDPDGRMNSNFTAANIVWLVIGALLWMLVALGVFLLATGAA